MAVYLAGAKNAAAARTALKINYAVLHIINPALAAVYPKANYKIKQVVGVDRSNLFAARTGVRGDNDLVWVGRAANHAAKLSGLPSEYPSNITDLVYDTMLDEAKFGGSNKQPMWKRFTWSGRVIYRSTWWWRV